MTPMGQHSAQTSRDVDSTGLIIAGPHSDESMGITA